MNFNHEELMLMMLYNTGTRMGLICFILFFGATAITEGIGRFSEWLAEL